MKKYILCLFPVLFLSCRNMVEIAPPPNQLTPEKVFDNSSSALAAAANLYTVLANVDGNMILPLGIYTDELVSTSVDATSTEFTNSALTPANTRVLSIWQNLYSAIYKANSVIAGMPEPGVLPDSTRNQCLGEAFFIRGYAHQLLRGLYGEVPVATSTDVRINAVAPRQALSVVDAQVINDLEQAVTLLKPNYLVGADRIRANRWAASALLAKAYLATNRNAEAETLCANIINSGQYSLQALNNVFLAGSKEAILQLWNSSGFTTLNAVPASGVPIYQVAPSLLNSFAGADQRKTSWLKTTVVSGTTYIYPYKYKQRTTTTGAAAEYTMYLRLGDVYLLRAEARAKQNNLTGAASDLNLIRTRAGLPNATGDLLLAIQKERQLELFNEGASRFLDLQRVGTMDATLKLTKPLWQTSGVVLPIPQSELLTNPFLTQSNGY